MCFSYDPVKREAGANPARTRRCMRGVLLRRMCGTSLKELLLGRGSTTMILKSEDLPVMCAVNHEVLVHTESIFPVQSAAFV